MAELEPSTCHTCQWCHGLNPSSRQVWGLEAPGTEKPPRPPGASTHESPAGFSFPSKGLGLPSSPCGRELLFSVETYEKSAFEKEKGTFLLIVGFVCVCVYMCVLAQACVCVFTQWNSIL